MTSIARVGPIGGPALPPELTRPIPRDVRLTASGTAMVIIAGALVIGALASAIVMTVAVARASDRRQHAAVTARTMSVEQRRGEHPRRVVMYQFDVVGRVFQGRTTLREGDRRDLHRGDELPVEYSVSDPGVNWVPGHEPGRLPPWLIPIVSGSLLACAFLTAWRVRRDWMLLSEGRGALAKVTGQKKVRRDKHTAYQIDCVFQDLSGANHTMRYHVAKAPPSSGGAVAVVYHRDDPRWHAVYPLSFVSPARTVSARRRL